MAKSDNASDVKSIDERVAALEASSEGLWGVVTKVKKALERVLGLDIDKDGKVGGAKVGLLIAAFAVGAACVCAETVWDALGSSYGLFKVESSDGKATLYVDSLVASNGITGGQGIAGLTTTNDVLIDITPATRNVLLTGTPAGRTFLLTGTPGTESVLNSATPATETVIQSATPAGTDFLVSGTPGVQSVVASAAPAGIAFVTGVEVVMDKDGPNVTNVSVNLTTVNAITGIVYTATDAVTGIVWAADSAVTGIVYATVDAVTGVVYDTTAAVTGIVYTTDTAITGVVYTTQAAVTGIVETTASLGTVDGIVVQDPAP